MKRPNEIAYGTPPAPRIVWPVPVWLVLSLLTAVFYGLWGFTSKMVTAESNALTYQVLFSIGLLPLAIAIARRGQGLLSARHRLRGIALAGATGALGGLGNLALYEALNLGGKAGIVVPISSTYSLVTVILAFYVLRERITTAQKLGLASGFIAIILLGS